MSTNDLHMQDSDIQDTGIKDFRTVDSSIQNVNIEDTGIKDFRTVDSSIQNVNIEDTGITDLKKEDSSIQNVIIEDTGIKDLRKEDSSIQNAGTADAVLQNLLFRIVDNNNLHARFLNTLSLQENIGARKISASELPETTTFMVLKHAAEEHRHAFYLKKQMAKLAPGEFLTYQPDYLLAPYGSKFYLHKLDLETSRYLKNTMKLSGAALKFGAYLLVTYAIEVRADYLYPIYQQVLDRVGSKVSVKNIIVEEQGHLEEMIAQLKTFSPDWERHAENITVIENRLYQTWINDLDRAVC